jgi:hypothetical protein
MRPPNYRQAKKQKEQKRKLRQNEKQQRRSARAQQVGDVNSSGEKHEEGAQPRPLDGNAGRSS